MNNFNIIKRGYNTAEVDAYINQINRDNKTIIDEKILRIEELRNENYSQQKELIEYKKREDNVNQALITAIEKSKELEYSIKIRFELEYERIKLFRIKWEQYIETLFNEGIVYNDYKDTTNVLNNFEKEFRMNFLKGIALNNTVQRSSQAKVESGDVDSTTDEHINAQYLEESRRIIDKALNNTDLNDFDIDIDSLDDKGELKKLCAKLGLI